MYIAANMLVGTACRDCACRDCPYNHCYNIAVQQKSKNATETKQVIGLVAATNNFTPERRKSFRLPRPLSGQTLCQIAKRLHERLALEPGEAMHCISIANSGDGIAAATVLLYQTINPNGHTWYSSLNLQKPVNFLKTPQLNDCPVRTVLIDNSIKTGGTLRQALRVLRANGIKVDTVISLLSYGGTSEMAICEQISKDHGASTLFLFRPDEVFEITDEASIHPRAQSPDST